MTDFAEIQNTVAKMVRAEAYNAGQMTLGEFIDALTPLDQEKQIYFDFASLAPADLDSYRGYYDQLAFGFTKDGGTTVGAVLAKAKDALGKVYQGYKGGDYLMDEDTMLWVATYGNSGGSRIVGIEDREFDVLINTTPDV